jgi:hypothetical protein
MVRRYRIVSQPVVRRRGGPARRRSIVERVSAAAVGAALGAIGARGPFIGSGLSLIPWAAAGLLVGWLSPDLRTARTNGAVYGFALAFTFMAVGYDGAPAFLTRLPFFAALGLVGAACGVVLASLGRRLRSRARPPATPANLTRR